MVKDTIFKIWEKLPEGLQRKPLDFQISILLILVALSGFNITELDDLDFLYLESPLAMLLQFICVSYIFIGSLLIIIGLFIHHIHTSILSFCKAEIWGWRLIFSASTAMFIAEFFFGTQPGVSIGCLIWFLQALTSFIKLLQYYKEKSLEKHIWTI
jgi:hypothetical protein